jgi:hypothetical protein
MTMWVRRHLDQGDWDELSRAGVPVYIRFEVFRVCNLNRDREPMSYPKELPNPTGEYSEFVSKLMACPEAVNLQHFRDAAGKDRRLWMIESAMKCSMAVRDGLIKPELIDNGGETINSFVPQPDARDFWRNGAEQGISDAEILDGWKAMRSIVNDGKNE